MYWDESPVKNSVCTCVCACVNAQRAEGCSTLDKNSLKGKRTPTVLICSVSVFYCHALRSHPLLSLPLLICLCSAHPTPPSSSFFSLADISDTFISISHTVIFFFFYDFFYRFSSCFEETVVCLSFGQEAVNSTMGAAYLSSLSAVRGHQGHLCLNNCYRRPTKSGNTVSSASFIILQQLGFPDKAGIYQHYCCKLTSDC